MNKIKLEHLEQNIFSSKDTLISYRTLNHYDRLGLLNQSRSSTRVWRRFNSYELIWLHLIASLREIGFPLKKIKKLKKKIFEEGKKGSIDKANFINKPFQEEIFNSLANKYDLYILVFADCNYTFHDSASLKQWHLSIYKSEPHINIPLESIIDHTLFKLKKKIKA